MTLVQLDDVFQLGERAFQENRERDNQKAFNVLHLYKFTLFFPQEQINKHDWTDFC
jgi:hypothetical protein